MTDGRPLSPGQVLDALDRLAAMAEKSISNFVVAVAALALGFALDSKIDAPGLHFATLRPEEFIALVVLSLVLFLFGVAVRVYVRRTSVELKMAWYRIQEKGPPPDSQDKGGY